jgi:hypothetical protein
MTTQVTPESIKQFFEQAAKAYGDVWKSQADYYDGLVRRNTQYLTELADARIASYREMSESQTFNQAFEANLAFEEKVREDLTRLQEKNTEAWQHLVDELQSIYTPARKASQPKAAPKAKATPKAKKAA